MRVVSIHPAQTPDVSAEYDPMISVPYPFHIEPDGSVARQDFWRGDPQMLLGFQETADRQRVVLLTAAWLAGDLQKAVGMWPVFSTSNGGMWAHRHPVQRVTEG